MNIVKVVAGFVPSILFSVLISALGPGWAALVGCAAALIVVAVTAGGGVKILPGVQAVVLAVFAVCALATASGATSLLGRYGPAAVGVVLGTFMIASAWAVPFTVQYARSSVAPQLWHDPRFLAVNRRISVAWGLAVLAVGLCGLAAAAVTAHGGGVIPTLLLQWVVPVLAFWRVIIYTNLVAAAGTRRAAAVRTEPGVS